MKRETPRFPPSALKPTPPANHRLCFPDCHPLPRSRTIGRTDGGTAQALPGPAQGRKQGGQEGIWGSALGAPCLQPGWGPLWPPPGGCLGILVFFLSLPVRSLAVGVALAGWTPMGVGKRWPRQALAASPAWLGDATITSHSTPGPAPPTHPGRRSREERRGEERRGHLRRGPHPAAPASPPAPPRPWRRRRVLSLLPARKAEGLFKF